jgi:hypothetical protein
MNQTNYPNQGGQQGGQQGGGKPGPAPINGQVRAASRAATIKVVSRAAVKASRGSRAANASNPDAGLGVPALGPTRPCWR